MVRLGLGLMVVAAVLLALLDRALGPLGYLLPILLLTAGYALFQTANNSAVVGRRRGEPGAVAGLLTLSRNLGQLTGAAGLGACSPPWRGGPISPRDGGRAGVCHPGHLRPDGLAADECALVGGKGERAVQDDVARDGCESEER